MRISLLQRYVIKEFLLPFGVGLLVFTFILILNHLFYMMDIFLNRGVGIGSILKMSIFILPMFLPLSIPMAALLAALISYGRFSEDGELTALRSAGCPHLLYSLPNVLLGLFFSLFLVYFNLNAAPRAALEFENMKYTVAQKNPLAMFVPKIMNHFGEYRVIIEQMDRRKKKLTGISIYKINPLGAPTRILAPEGELDSFPDGDFNLVLLNGAVHQPNPDKDNEYTITKFNRFVLRIPAKIETEARNYSAREMTCSELRNKIRESIREKSDPTEWKTEFNFRIAIAFAPLVFILLGIVLGVSLRKGSKSIGIGMSVVVILLYYGLFILATSLSSRKFFSPLALAWMPNFIAVLAASLFWFRLCRQ